MAAFTDPVRLLIDERPMWRFDDGTYLPVVSGGADDPPADPPADPADDPADDNPPDEVAEMRRALRKANKEAEQARLKLKEIEDAGKSETERLSGRVSELEPKLTAAETRAMRLEVALDKGLPKSLAVRLQGETQEEMEADADELMKTLGDTGRKPTPSFDNGVKPKDAPTGGSFLQEALANRGR